MASRESVSFTLEPFDHNLLINGMNEFRNMLLKDERPTEDVDRLLLFLIDRKPRKERRKYFDRGER